MEGRLVLKSEVRSELAQRKINTAARLNGILINILPALDDFGTDMVNEMVN